MKMGIKLIPILGMVLTASALCMEEGSAIYRKNKEAPLHLAVISNDIQKVESMLQERCEGINLRDTLGFTALHYAAGSGNLELVRLLINYGADINALGPEEESSLHQALSLGHNDVVVLLLEFGANHIPLKRQLKNIFKKEPLLQLLIAGKSPSTKALRKFYESKKDSLLGHLKRSLSILINRYNREIINFIFDEYGSKLNEDMRNEIFIQAAQQGNIEFLKFLYSKARVPSNVSHEAFLKAAQFNQYDAIEFLCRIGSCSREVLQKVIDLNVPHLLDRIRVMLQEISEDDENDNKVLLQLINQRAGEQVLAQTGPGYRHIVSSEAFSLM